MSGHVVVDASLAIKWVLKEPHADKALALAREWAATETRPAAPCLLLVEVANVLHSRAALGHITQAQAKRLMAGVLEMGIEIRESPQIHIRALELARELQMPATYATHYLALAEILDCELWTADERFFDWVKVRQPRVKWLGNYG